MNNVKIIIKNNTWKPHFKDSHKKIKKQMKKKNKITMTELIKV